MTQSHQTLELEADVRAPFPLTVPVLLVAGLLCLESMLFLAFASARIAMFSYIGVHASLCVAALALGGWWAGRHSLGKEAADRTAMVLQLVAWTGLAGPFGALTAVGLLVPHNVGATGRAGDGARGQATMSRLELLHGSLLDRRLRLEAAHSIRSLMDVVIDGTQLEKLDALSLISKSFVPALAPPLKRALEDKDAAVRVLAATVMAQQHNIHMREIGGLRAEAEAEPESPTLWRELGQAHRDYAGSGLLEASRAEAELSQADAHLARAERLERSIAKAREPVDA
jgi:hypothetical protein